MCTHEDTPNAPSPFNSSISDKDPFGKRLADKNVTKKIRLSVDLLNDQILPAASLLQFDKDATADPG